VIDLKRKILVIAVALMTVAMLALPMIANAQACMFRRTTRIEKIEGVTFGPLDPSVPPNRVTTSVHNFGKIRISKGTTTDNIVLTHPTMGTLIGTWYSEPTATTRFTAPATDPPATDPNAKVVIVGKVVWTFSGPGTTGTFEGWLLQNYIGYPPVYPIFSSYMYTRMVLCGTGNFEGQTLVLAYEGTTPDGYLLIRK
jgi:hypothetical protein